MEDIEQRVLIPARFEAEMEHATHLIYKGKVKTTKSQEAHDVMFIDCPLLCPGPSCKGPGHYCVECGQEGGHEAQHKIGECTGPRYCMFCGCYRFSPEDDTVDLTKD